MGPQTRTDSNEAEPQILDVSIPTWAGQVRDVLKESGPLPFASLARRVANISTNEVAMAVGWLVHAGEIRFTRRGTLWLIAFCGLRSET
jgi:hypothetical protein